MPFTFSLASVLRVRESIEKREERVLQRLQAEIARVQRQIDDADRVLATTDRTREAALQQPISASQLRAMLAEAEAVGARKIGLADSLRTLQQQRDLQFKAYAAAHRDHEILLGLFREQRSAYEQEQVRIEQRQLDDLFMARFHKS